MVGTVLLIDASGRTVQVIRRACDALGVGVTHVESFDAAAAFLNSGSAELVVGDFESVRQLRSHRPGVPTVLLADASNSQQTIESIKHGSLDCVIAPLRDEEVMRRLGEALRLCEEVAQPPAEKPSQGQGLGVRLVGQSPAMQEVYKLVGMIASREINVLITGESGTGKELIARAIYEHSERVEKPFLAVNCAAIPETLLESELFGHEKGAFTGADQRRIGKFEQCHGGTLFLDEIGDIPLATQAKLLRVLEDRSFQRLGGNETVTCDVRIIAATHQPLEQMIRDKRFRQDLYYRLKVATIHLPALRDREVDAVLLAHYFVDRIGRQMGTQVRRFAPETVAALLAYPWPGNVRELENVVRASLAMARGGTVFRPEILPAHIREAASGGPADAASAPPATASAMQAPEPAVDPLDAWAQQMLSPTGPRQSRLFAASVGQAERALICAALRQTDGSLAQAAELLGISRTTLRKKMRDQSIAVKAGPVLA